MFATEQGCKDALIGCYELLSDQGLYGATLTCTFLDVLGQQYELSASASSEFERLSRYMYSAYMHTIDDIWSRMYNTIANINALIEGLEVNQANLNPTIYSLSKAEAYALRSFVYVDLVRLFTWGNIAERPEKLDELSIPYAKVYDKYIVPQESLRNVLKYIHEDLEIALDLFEQYDPDSQVEERPENYSVPNEDGFYDDDKRKFRMNLKAALALRMRLYMWEGKYDEAYTDAMTLMEFEPTWVNSLDAAENERDLTFSTEMLFGVETYQRFDNIVKTYFQLKDGIGTTNQQAFYLRKERLDNLYETKELGISDWRYNRLWDMSAGDMRDSHWGFLKFWEYDNMTYTDIMPLIKWPEVYYTAAECLLRKGNSEAQPDPPPFYPRTGGGIYRRTHGERLPGYRTAFRGIGRGL